MSSPLRKHIEEATSECTDEEFEYIASHFTTVTRKRHQYIVQERDSVTNEYWVVKGCLKAILGFITPEKSHFMLFLTELFPVFQ